MLRALLFGVFAVLISAPPAQRLCSGFLPENDLNIPVTDASLGGLSQADFNAVLDQIEQFYAPIVAAKGGRLHVNREWNDGTVNASANRSGGTWTINMYGGLARHPNMNKDAFTLVACHEMGHHLGGAPKVSSWWGGDDWASNEGEADYFASLRCLRYMYNDADNSAFVQAGGIDPTLKTKCETIYDTQAEENLCMRIGMAGFVGASLFQTLNENSAALNFATPDQNAVSQTADGHPAPQCRLDTYYQGGICRHDLTVDLSDTDATVGTCNESTGQHDGLRPRCWFKP
jgi:hypothetical protein